MKILSIDTSSNICSVSILEDENVILEKQNNDMKTHSQKLMPLVDELFNETKLKLKDIDLFACCVGPGSFTGIRIGVSTIKAFADVTGLPVVGVTSLEGLAYNLKRNGYICSVIDAKNDNVYYGLFEFNNNEYKIVGELKLDNIDSVLDTINKYKNIVFVGDGAITHKEKILSKIENPEFVEEIENLQTSVSIARIALDEYKKGNAIKSEGLFPIYLRKSQAERALEGEK